MSEVGLVALGTFVTFIIAASSLWLWLRSLSNPKRAFAFAVGFFKGLAMSSNVAFVTIATSAVGPSRRDIGSSEERVAIPIGAIIEALERGDVILAEKKGMH